jgi:acylphosphatase
MKLKITITGPKVHDVGYRYFLMSMALDLGLIGFHARNRKGKTEQQLIVLVEGDKEIVEDFKALVDLKKPDRSLVSDITFEDFGGSVTAAGDYAQFCTAVQINKAIPLLLDIRDDMKEMKGDMKEMKGDMKEMKGDMKEMKGDIKSVIANTEAIPQIYEEIKEFRYDIQPGIAMQLQQVQSDIRAIKERLGMP